MTQPDLPDSGPPTPGSWIERYRVRASEIGPDGAFSPRALCLLLQETAGRHVVQHGLDVETLRAQRHTWVLSRLRVEWSASLAWLDTVEVETWATGVERLHALRDFELRGPGAVVVARAVSAWLLLDLESHRPQRPAEAIASLRADPDRRVLPVKLGKLPAVPPVETPELVRVRRADLDVNQHVNNVAYVGWLLDAVESQGKSSHGLQALEINFLGEAFAGEDLQVHSHEDPAREQLQHSILRPSDGRELIRAVSSWAAS